MATYTRTGSYTFVDFIQEITAKFCKVVVLVDNCSGHLSCLVGDFVKKSGIAPTGAFVWCACPSAAPSPDAVR